MPPAKRLIGAVLLIFVTATLLSATALTQSSPDVAMPKEQAISNDDAVKNLNSWPAGPRSAGYEMIGKYGAPQELTDNRMIWHNAGPFKRILLTREELPHHFPIMHMDYLQHTISYNVPTDKASDLLAFDGAILIYRVGGELSARCDLESNNILALNLAHDIIENEKSVDQARKEFGEAVMARTAAERPATTTELQFKPQTPKETADPDSVSIPGAPRPAETEGESAGADAETLALLIAADMNTVHAAMFAQNKKVAESILDYARMMHESHGKHIKATFDVGMNNNVSPVVTKNVTALQDQHAAALSDIMALEGDAFGRAYIDFVIKAASDAQDMIDKRLDMIDKRIAMPKNENVRNHLTETRQLVTKHLEQARELQDEAARS